ncbi:short transient receptor potential channel 7-like [Bolinopsis microptera]|uniref:short transient receptor potential channel 7-like n=1 Tax=Bolinopsis microptera TaxID=2820187 RepID=UPI00307ACEFD
MNILSFADRAEYDNTTIRELLNPPKDAEFCVPAAGTRLSYLKDPVAWINSYSGHVNEFTEDDHYLEYVVGLLEAIVNSSPYSGQDVYSPILLLEKVVTRKALMQRRDPMRTALRLQSRLLEYAKIENDNNSIYDRSIEKLELIPKKFALSLMEVCVTPIEVIKLMRLDDDTMFQDVLQSKNVELVASKIYQKVVWKKFWGSEAIMKKKARSGNLTQTFYVAKRIAIFLFWNIFYIPAAIFTRDDRISRKRRAIFFSPFSSYLADLLNYSMLITFLLVVIMYTEPDPKVAHELVQKLIEGEIKAENDTNFKVGADGSVMMRLPNPKIPFSEWLLWTCIFARVLSELYQAYSKKGKTLQKKLNRYFKSFYNITDIFLIILLLTSMISKLYTFLKSWMFGVYVSIDHLVLDPDPSDMNRNASNSTNRDSFAELVHHELIFTIYFYCTGAVVALVHLLQVYTIHIPGLGPLILSAKRTFVEVSGLVFIYLFVIAGFLIPIVGMMTCYRVVHGIDGVGADDENDFYYFATFGKALVTLVWTMFGGLDVEHRSNLHRSRDTLTTVFIVILLVLYAIILGLLCMNLVIAIIVDVYSKVTADKYADWRFSQFECIIDYSGGSNEGDGMPFLFPMCIPYILYSMLIQPWNEKKYQEKNHSEMVEDNQFARFLCQCRLDQPIDE